MLPASSMPMPPPPASSCAARATHFPHTVNPPRPPPASRALTDTKINSIMTLSDPRQLEAVPMCLLATAIRSSILAQRTGLSIIPTIATCVATTPQNGKHHCRFLLLLPPITRNVKLPIPTIRLEFPLGHESPAGSNSKNGKNGNVHRASQHCRPTTAPYFLRVYCRHVLRDVADDMPRRFALSAYPSDFSPLAVRRHFSAARSENERSER